ncbi:MAG: diguanylate cyclase [Microcoleaceae cyanobacterium]
MLLDSLRKSYSSKPNIFSHLRAKIPLRRLLIVPFFVQVCGVSGLIGYLSYTSGQRAIWNLADQLMNQTVEGVKDHLDTHIQTPAQLLTLNILAAQQGNLNLEDPVKLEKQFWQQIRTFEEITDLTFTSSTGQYTAVGRDKKGYFSKPGSIFSATGDKGQRQYFLSDPSGQRTKQVYSLPNWDERSRPWYQQAIELDPNTLSWAAVFPWAGQTVAATKMIIPVHQQGKFVGVLGSNIILSDINIFLSQLKFSPNGQIFVIERSGKMVATSTQEQLFVESIENETRVRLAAMKSQDWLTRRTTQTLLQQAPNLEDIQHSLSFQFIARPPATNQQLARRRRYFTHVVPYRDQYGFNWLIVLTVPETDFMGNIYRNIQKTGLWVGVVLVGTIVLGSCTAKWVTRPIIQLQKAAKSISQESCCIALPQTPIVEIQDLSDVFSRMDHRLCESFEAMESLNQELFESKERLQKFLECLPIAVAIHGKDGQIIYMNPMGKKYLQKEVPQQAEFEELTEYYQVYIAGTDIPYPPEKLPAAKALAGEVARTEDLEIRTRQNPMILEVQATPILDNQKKITHAVVTFQDITARKQAEELIKNYNSELQKQVKQRTQALEEANIKLEEIAQTDALTKIPNRRQFDQGLQVEWRRLLRSQKPLSLLLIDIDYFKRYNDYYGHPQGDLCLFKVAQTLQQAVYRASDLVARYGGEEFVVILPETNQAGAINIAKRIQKSIISLEIPHQTSEVSDFVTCSIGIASLIPSPNTQPANLVAQADKALYVAKAEGRNCYRVISSINTQIITG